MSLYYMDPDNRGLNQLGQAEPLINYEQSEPVKSNLHRYFIAVFAAAVIVIVAVTSHFHSVSASSQTGQVSITSSQFSPSTIHIKAGMSVVWTNNDVSVHQVAADPFPADSSVPGFDNKLMLLPHNTSSYIFENKGTYTFHDELNPYNLKGTVIVE